MDILTNILTDFEKEFSPGQKGDFDLVKSTQQINELVLEAGHSLSNQDLKKALIERGYQYFMADGQAFWMLKEHTTSPQMLEN